MVPAGDQAQAAIALAMHPFGGLAGIAKGVGSGMADHDAAGGVLGHRPQRVQQLVAVDVLIDAGDEQLFRLAGGEELEAGFEPQAASRHDDDRVGRVRRVGADPVAAGDKPDQPGEP